MYSFTLPWSGTNDLWLESRARCIWRATDPQWSLSCQYRLGSFFSNSVRSATSVLIRGVSIAAKAASLYMGLWSILNIISVSRSLSLPLKLHLCRRTRYFQQVLDWASGKVSWSDWSLSSLKSGLYFQACSWGLIVMSNDVLQNNKLEIPLPNQKDIPE